MAYSHGAPQTPRRAREGFQTQECPGEGTDEALCKVKEGFSLYIEKVLILVHQLEEYFMRVCALNY